ncbi:hypothetical protein DPMN_191348 [Dreissena polymorpha]|uniref:Uncharacterized protein n=1 Tax=Dreissena polymorpha TaxID=45954 RepID=A0A9D4BFP2_DREPO|nr:hypothetical protein DPMN_191348 [Dreissena polymorpha]
MFEAAYKAQRRRLIRQWSGYPCINGTAITIYISRPLLACSSLHLQLVVVVKAFKITKIVELREGGGGFAPLDPYQDYALHPPEVLAAPLDHQQNFEYPAPHPKPEIPDPPLWTGSKIPIFSDMIICRRSQNPFLPSCLRALSKSVSARVRFFERPQTIMPSKTCIIPIVKL